MIAFYLAPPISLFPPQTSSHLLWCKSDRAIFQLKILSGVPTELRLFSPWWCISKESACSAGDPGSIPGSGRSPGEGNGNPLQYSCLGNPMDRGAWWATVHGVAKSQIWLSNSTTTMSCLISASQTPPRHTHTHPVIPTRLHLRVFELILLPVHSFPQIISFCGWLLHRF